MAKADWLGVGEDGETTIRDALDAFLLRCETENLTPASIGWYEDVLGRFVRFCENTGTVRLEQIGERQVEAFLKERKAQGCGATSQNAYLRALRALFRWLVAREYLPTDPLRHVVPRRAPERMRLPLEDEEIRTFLGAFDLRRFPEVRDWARCWLHLDSGARLFELNLLLVGAVDLEHRRILVEGKRRKERLLVFGEEMARVLRRYLTARERFLTRRGRDPKTVPWLFFSTRSLKPMDRNAVSRSLARIAKRAGLSQRVGTHLLRHTGATQVAARAEKVASRQVVDFPV